MTPVSAYSDLTRNIHKHDRALLSLQEAWHGWTGSFSKLAFNYDELKGKDHHRSKKRLLCYWYHLFISPTQEDTTMTEFSW